MWRFCCNYARWIWNVYDGWDNPLFRASSQATKVRNIFEPIKILFWFAEKVWNGELKEVAILIATNCIMDSDEAR